MSSSTSVPAQNQAGTPDAISDTTRRDGAGAFGPAHRADRIRVDPAAREAARRWWWVPLVAGVLWTLYGMLVLSLRPTTVLSLAILAGIAFIAGGISQFLIAQRAREWRWLFYIGGVLGIAAGVVAFFWPDITLFALAVFVAWYLVISGIFTVVAALVGPKRDWWWIGLIVGLLQFVLGIWAIGSPARELLLLVTVVGVSMIFYGVDEIFAAFALRSMADEPEAVAADRPDVPTSTPPAAPA